jgi:hypothetical protein
MNQKKYFDYIEERLTTLATRIKLRGQLNILDLNIHSEDFYCRFLNLLYEYKRLTNLNNSEKQNIEAIDLIDTEKKIYIQVSATASKQKIESTLSKEVMKDHSDFTFKFILISIDDNKLEDKDYKNPFGIKFNPKSDIISLRSILHSVKSLDLVKMKFVYEFIQQELGNENNNKNIHSNLTKIINLLAQENLSEASQTTIPFSIEQKITYNKLSSSRSIIDSHAAYCSILEKIYKIFDAQGINTSISVLMRIQKEYNKLKKNNPDELFDNMRNNLRETIIHSGNYEDMAGEELDLCLDILVVDAFMRCKIFENPQENLNAST